MKINIIKSNRKTVALYVSETGDLTVKAPFNYPDDKIYNFIKSKEVWIKKHIENKSEILYKYEQVITKRKGLIFNKIVDITDDFKNVLLETSFDYLPKRLNYLAEKLGFNYNKLKIKNYKSRWGACDKNKNVYLSYKLIMIDKDLIDYVILHELCHTKFFNHKKEFHNLLKSYFINERELNKRLKKFSFISKIEY